MFKLRKGRGARNQIANTHWIIEKAREFQKNIYSALLNMPKPLTMWITTNWKIRKEMEIQDHLTCLLRNLYAGQEATVRTRYGTTGKESEAAQSCPTLCDLMDCSPPGSSAHGILQARILEWIAIFFSRRSS